jgi:hypothetical protein
VIYHPPIPKGGSNEMKDGADCKQVVNFDTIEIRRKLNLSDGVSTCATAEGEDWEHRIG